MVDSDVSGTVAAVYVEVITVGFVIEVIDIVFSELTRDGVAEVVAGNGFVPDVIGKLVINVAPMVGNAIVVVVAFGVMVVVSRLVVALISIEELVPCVDVAAVAVEETVVGFDVVVVWVDAVVGVVVVVDSNMVDDVFIEA